MGAQWTIVWARLLSSSPFEFKPKVNKIPEHICILFYFFLFLISLSLLWIIGIKNGNREIDKIENSRNNRSGYCWTSTCKYLALLSRLSLSSTLNNNKVSTCEQIKRKNHHRTNAHFSCTQTCRFGFIFITKSNSLPIFLL